MNGGQARGLVAREHGLAQQEHQVVPQLGPLPLQRQQRGEHRCSHGRRQREHVLEQLLESVGMFEYGERLQAYELVESRDPVARRRPAPDEPIDDQVDDRRAYHRMQTEELQKCRAPDQSHAHRHRQQPRARAGATTGDGHGRSALDPFGGGVGVCIGEIDAASELTADAAATHDARHGARAPLGRASESGATSLLGWLVEEGGGEVDEGGHDVVKRGGDARAYRLREQCLGRQGRQR